MKKKINLKLLLLVVFSILLYSCIHDDLNFSAENSISKEYNSKSVWKEDETYIKNVMKVYQENETEIKKVNGTPLWDYAMTIGHTDESFLIVPVVNGKTIVSCLKVPRNGNYITFISDTDPEHIKFFQGYTTIQKRKAIKQEQMSSESARGIVQCAVSTVSMWYPNSETNPDAGGHWETQYITTCSEIGGGDTPTNPNPEGPTYPYPGGGGGGGSTGSNSSNTCQKIKDKQNNTKYRQKYDALNKSEIFNKDSERGFYELQPPVGVNVESGFVQVDGPPGSTGLDLPTNTDRITGLFHTHNNAEGSVKIFSPTDVRTFVNMFVSNAKVFLGNYADAYSTVVTSSGSYTLKYSLMTSPPGVTRDTAKIWNAWYKREMSRAVSPEDGSIDQSKVEQIFMQFLNDVVKIEGLEIFKVSSNTSEKLTYNPTTKVVTSVPCP